MIVNLHPQACFRKNRARLAYREKNVLHIIQCWNSTGYSEIGATLGQI